MNEAAAEEEESGGAADRNERLPKRKKHQRLDGQKFRDGLNRREFVTHPLVKEHQAVDGPALTEVGHHSCPEEAAVRLHV